MVTVNEKWVTYHNVKRKKRWSNRDETAQTVLKPGLMVRTLFLCILFNWQEIIDYELLLYGHTHKSIPSDYYLIISIANDFVGEKFVKIDYPSFLASYQTKRCIFYLNRIILKMSSKSYILI